MGRSLWGCQLRFGAPRGLGHREVGESPIDIPEVCFTGWSLEAPSPPTPTRAGRDLVAVVPGAEALRLLQSPPSPGMGAWTSPVKVTVDSKRGAGGVRGAQGHNRSSQYSQWVLDAPGPRALGRTGTDPDLARPPGHGALGLLVIGTSFAAFRGLHWGPQLLPTPRVARDRSNWRTSVSPCCTACSRGPERSLLGGS